MRIQLCGAAGEVTGSGYLIETDRSKVLVDFGVFQGERDADERNRVIDPVRPEQLDAIVLTHGHLDHCGRLPMLVQGRLKAKIHATPATCDFAQLVLADSAHLMEADARRENRRRQRQGRQLVEPLYGAEEVEWLMGRFAPVEYGEDREIAPGISIRLHEAGHMLGSASVAMTVQESDGPARRLVFSGDIGPKAIPFLRDPDPPTTADLMFLESTYGDRDHKSMDATLEEFRAILNDAAKGRERVLIPAFAIGRSQQLLYYISDFLDRRLIEPMPVYLDSPMAVRATRLYQTYEELFDEEARALSRSQRGLQATGNLHFTETAEESKALNSLRDAAVIISASGMCEGGRILHHLKHNLWRHYVHLVFVGYQAQGTLGRRIVDGAKVVHVLGDEVVVGAQVHTLGGFSAHAGQTELVAWAAAVAGGGKPRIVLTHGEDPPRAALQGRLQEQLGIRAECPRRGGTITL